MQEPEVFELDARMNARGVRVDLPNAKRLFEVTELLSKQATTRLTLLTQGQVSSINAVAQFNKWLTAQGWPMPDLRKETVEAVLDKPGLPATVREVLQLRANGAKASTRKLLAMLNSVAADGRIHGLLYYYGAHTGRWTSKLVQIQNLPRGILSADEQSLLLDELAEYGPRVFIERISEKYNPLDVVSSLLRPLFYAEDDSQLLVMDYSSIEPRVLMWLAGQEHALDSYRNQEDLYVQMAGDIYHVADEEVTRAMRQVGKAAVLGCGYGMGARKFALTCESQGIEMDEESAKEVINSYRTVMNRVPIAWRVAEQAAITATDNIGKTYAVLGGKLAFYHDGTFLQCRLPSGRLLMYPFAHCVFERRFEGADPEARLVYSGNVSQLGNKFMEKSIWGGTWIENIVQAISRDLMVDAMLNLEKAGLNPIFSVHDEVVCEVTKKELKKGKNLELMEKILTTLPNWAAGLPVAAEGYVSSRYRK
jgi:DNA polymerase